MSSAELAQELPFSEEPGTGPWDTPSERVESIKKSNHAQFPQESITPSAKKKLKFTPQVSSAELAQELPFSEEPGTGPWDTPSERVESIKKSNHAQFPQESSWCSQKERQKSGQESLGLENVENPVMGRTQRRRAAAPRSRQRRRRSQRGGKLFDVQKLLNKMGMEFHWPGYQYMGPGTHLKNDWPAGIPASTG